MKKAESTIVVGIVSSRNTSDGLVRCYFPDMDNAASDWLYVIQKPGYEDLEMPNINDGVLVLFPSGWDMDGYVLGVIP